MRLSTQFDGVSVSDLGSDVRLIACPAGLETREAVDELQDACLAALDQGVRRLAVDVSAPESLSLDSLQLIVVIADILAARGGRLLLACRDGEEGSYQVLALEGEAHDALGRIAAARGRGAPFSPVENGRSPW